MNTRKLGTIEVSPIGMAVWLQPRLRRNSSQRLQHPGHPQGPRLRLHLLRHRRILWAEPAAGKPGHNERIVGEAVHDFRRQVVLATKLHLDAAEVSAKGLETVMAGAPGGVSGASPDRLRRPVLSAPHQPGHSRGGRGPGDGQAHPGRLIRGWGLS